MAEGDGPARRLLGLQAVDAVRSVACFPAPLGGDGMSKGRGDVDLGRQLALAQHDGHKSHMKRIVQSDTIENLMAAEDDAIAITVIKPEEGIDESACVVGVGFQAVEQ